MKKNIILAIAFIILIILNSKAQVVSISPDVIEISDDKKSDVTKRKYVFKTPALLDDEISDVDYFESHFLGETVAKKMHMIKNLYVKQSEVTVGFGNTHVEIQKPAIFNAIIKIENHLKKEVKKGKISKGLASEKYSKYLDCAYVAFFDAQTEDFEHAIQKARRTGALMEIFDSVEIANY